MPSLIDKRLKCWWCVVLFWAWQQLQIIKAKSIGKILIKNSLLAKDKNIFISERLLFKTFSSPDSVTTPTQALKKTMFILQYS
jgi:hypothetical protein